MGLIEQHVVIIADIVRSRDLPDRERVQDRLRAALSSLLSQESFAAALARDADGPIPPDITAGDEVQVLLQDGAVPETNRGTSAVWYLAYLTEALRPLGARVAFGLGVGALSMRLRRPVRELDGECFHLARASLESAKRRGVWAAVTAPDSRYAEVANALMRLVGDIRLGWTDRQAEVIRAYERLGVQKEVAEELSVSPSVISEVLNAARYDSVVEAESALASVLDWTIDSVPPSDERSSS